jgi:hypothetical protein
MESSSIEGPSFNFDEVTHFSKIQSSIKFYRFFSNLYPIQPIILLQRGAAKKLISVFNLL